jgi:HEAT repeat protein
VNALAAVGARDQAMTQLFGNWARSYPDADVRRAVLQALPNMKDPGSQANTLVAALQNETDTGVRVQEIQTLGLIGKGNPEVEKTLKGLLDAADPEIRKAAKEALANLEQK